MPSGFVAHYTTPLTADELTASLSAFESTGLLLENPSTRAASLLDEVGHQIRTDRAGLERAVAGAVIGHYVTFQLWLSELADVVCSYLRLSDGLTVRRYWLDGLSPDEKERVITSVSCQLAFPNPRTIAFLVDRRWVAPETDFDAIVREAGERYKEFAVDLFLMS